MKTTAKILRDNTTGEFLSLSETIENQEPFYLTNPLCLLGKNATEEYINRLLFAAKPSIVAAVKHCTLIEVQIILPD